MKYWSEFELFYNSTYIILKKKIHYDILNNRLQQDEHGNNINSNINSLLKSFEIFFSSIDYWDARWRQLRLYERDARPRCDKMSDRWMARTYDLCKGVHVISITNLLIWQVSKNTAGTFF